MADIINLAIDNVRKKMQAEISQRKMELLSHQLMIFHGETLSLVIDKRLKRLVFEDKPGYEEWWLDYNVEKNTGAFVISFLVTYAYSGGAHDPNSWRFGFNLSVVQS